MRYGIISDIHSNLEALTAVINACRHQKIEKILCLGDILGYGASPKECLDLIIKTKAICIAGNHDWAVSGKLDASYFPEDGKEAIAWTRTKLSFEEISSFNNLNLVYANRDLMMAHGSPYKPEAFNYLKSREKAASAFKVMNKSICFLGHTHIPEVYVNRDTGIISMKTFEFEINPKYQYIVNIGSVGQPRDGNSMASYCIYDTALGMIEIKRVQYDIALAQEKILAAGFPTFLAQRLKVGK